MKISDQGLFFIRHFEGFKPFPYNCPAGHATIGIGRLLHYGACDGRASEKPYSNGITEQQAYELLRQDCQRFEKTIKDNVKIKLKQNQFDALLSLVYNIGDGAFLYSTLLKKINESIKFDISNEVKEWWLMWNKILNPITKRHEVCQGLVKRREAEYNLYSEGIYL